MAALLTQFYQGHRFIPDEILLPVELDDREVREDYLRENKGKRVTILSPQRGAKSELVEMARENARQSFSERHDQEKAREKMLQELQSKISLRNYQQQIERFDISILNCAQDVDSM